MQWKRAAIDGLYRCGNCRTDIRAGELVAITKTGAERCEPCGRRIEDPPESIESDETQSGVPRGVRHQASLGFDGRRMASTGEVARQHVARHFNRRRRA
jgi:DNA-directed RNA polymerase subunit RPC12/RpoP